MGRPPLIVAALVSGGLVLASGAPAAAKCTGGRLPDLRTVVPKHLQIQNDHQRELLRFTNGIANTGDGAWDLHAGAPHGDPLVTDAIQRIFAADGITVVCTITGSTFEFHPEHNHWHIGDVALFEVRLAWDDGTGGRWGKPLRNDLGEAQSIKVTFCLIDWYQLDDNSPTTERVYWECGPEQQGISVGWVDQYHQSLEGQEIDVTGAPPGIYYLVSTVNADRIFLEKNWTNNTAWVSFRLSRDSQGNPKITEIAHSRCDGPGLCGEQATNR